MNRKVELSEENYDLLDEVIHQLCEQGRLLEEQNAMQHGSTSFMSIVLTLPIRAFCWWRIIVCQLINNH